MEEKVSVENIEKIVVAVAAVGNVLEKFIAEQGGIVKRLSHLVSLGGEAIALTSLEPSKLAAEFKNIDDAEKAQLLASFKAKFDLSNDEVEAKVEGALGLAVKTESLVEEIVGFAKSFKKA